MYSLQAVPQDLRDKIIRLQQVDARVMKLRKDIPNPYILKEDLLFFKDGGSERIVLPECLVDEFIQDFHDPPLMGHLGQLKVFRKMKSRFHFPRMRERIQTVIRACVTCQMRKGRPEGPIGCMVSIPTKGLQVNDLVAIDVQGPYPTSSKGNTHIIVAIEYATRLITARAIRKVTSESCASFVVTNIICQFGLPKTLLTDNASVFTSHFFKQVHEMLGIRKIYSTPYHSEGNGLVENANRQIQDILSKYIQSRQRDWDVYLPMALFAINTSVHTSTKYSPFYLMYGRIPNLPTDIVLDTNNDAPTPVLKLQEIRQQAADNSAKAQQVQRTVHDRKVNNITFDVDDQVFVYTPTGKPGKSKKLTLYWHGPYKIVEKSSNLNYIVSPVFPYGKQRGRQRVHIKRMKAYHPSKDSTMSDMTTHIEEVERESDESDLESDSSLDQGNVSIPQERSPTEEIPKGDPLPVVPRSGRKIKPPNRLNL